jgi:hypothetical protein
MATASLTTSPTQIDAGSSDNVSITNTGTVDVVVARGAQSFTLKPTQGRVVYPEGVAVTAATVSGTGSVSYTATAARVSAASQFAADPAFTGTYARPRPNTFVALGDSLMAISDLTTTQGRFGQSLAVSIAVMSQGRLHLLKNAGTTGNTSAMVLARFDTDVTPYSPGYVITEVGTNDINTSVTLTTYLANIAAVDAKVKAIGAQHVICAIPPNAGAGKRSVLDL